MDVSELKLFRNEIDEIDEQIIQMLARRFVVTRKVGQIKALQKMTPVDATREHQQALRYELLANKCGLNPVLVAQLFRCIVDEVILDHGSIKAI